MQRGIGLTATWHEEAVPESGDEFLVLLPGGKDGGDDASLRTGENLDQLTHLAAHISGEGTCVREAESNRGAVGECIRDQCASIGPPAIYSGLAYSGALCHGFNREI